MLTYPSSTTHSFFFFNFFIIIIFIFFYTTHSWEIQAPAHHAFLKLWLLLLSIYPPLPKRVKYKKILIFCSLSIEKTEDQIQELLLLAKVESLVQAWLRRNELLNLE